ncbi:MULTISPECIES: dihydrodipicolinate synthase family protein [unclassified Leucobacter]|uniref:dihydrodipicolinate synthase family protein n=1 Tax=unclassified Leucobacter TaxID=2621730 RepID=UPI00165E111F|nr:dihydrodipicolinate synthase family protein [Leucobacter sp. CX169]MBC9927138.1 dihydrodipicolinate synthase family protein [Leucobacter sp. cx-169]MBC9936418.1 dihydrodipicolinate synthase family protein [Leucobacter sp. cx-87]
MTEKKPWHGVIVATALQFKDDMSVDYDAFGEHVAWLAANGCDGVAPNGSLGEYQNLSDVERAQVIKTAVDASPEGFTVMAGVGAYGALQSAHWATQAAEAGASCVMLLPPNTFRANHEQVKEHYATVAKAGLPIIGYNNPIDTKVDLVPELIADIFHAGNVVGVKEFSGDPRRIYEIKELAPEIDILIGTDDTVLEVGLAGAVGWVSGYPNAIPQTCIELFNLCTSGNVQDLVRGQEMYRDLHSLLRWDSKTEFVQAIKLSMDVVGLKGGKSRPPRGPLSPEITARIIADTEAAVAKGYGK